MYFDRLVQDSFSRANETPLAAPWAETGFNLVAESATPASLAADAFERYTGGPAVWPINQWCACAVTVNGTTSTSGPGPAIRMLSGGTDFYRLAVNHTDFELGKFKASVFSSVSGAVTNTFVDGDVFTLAIFGSRLFVLQNGVVKYTGIDGTPLAGAGQPGLGYSSTVTSCSVDNWSAGGVVDHGPRYMTGGVIRERVSPF